MLARCSVTACDSSFTMFLQSNSKCLKRCFIFMVLSTFIVMYSIYYSNSSSKLFLETITTNKSSPTKGLYMTLMDRLSWVDKAIENNDVVESMETSCRFPRLNPMEPYVVKLAGLDREMLKCNTGQPDLTYVQDNKLIVNKTIIQDNFSSFLNISCRYQFILRGNTDFSYTFGEPSKKFMDSIDLPPETECILVLCEGTERVVGDVSNQSNTSEITPLYKTKILSKTYFALIPKRDNLFQFENLRLRKRAVEVSPKETMNVIMIGLDSVPRYSFLRSMNRTYDLLMNDLMSFDMTMHSQVGKNSFPNFLPLLTGKSEEETLKWWHRENNKDEFDLIWKDFEKAGYRTLYTEDWPEIGIFLCDRPGFSKIPTVHYSNPLISAIEIDKGMRKAGRHCVGNQPEVMFHLEYLKRFMDTFKNKPLFAFGCLTRIGHDNITWIKTIDDHFYNFYTTLKSSGHLNNTMLITFSDHGLRFGPLRNTLMGDVENRNPILFLTLPPWFLNKYPDVAKNLKTNTGRLTTHYDTHSTMLDLLYFKSSGENPLSKLKHGTSLFQEIPKNRTCQDASIPRQFCLCGYENSLNVNGNLNISKFISETVVQAINSKIDQTLCQNLTLHSILEVMRLKTFNKKTELEQIDFRVKIETVPGNGIFQSVVYATDMSGGKPWDQLTVDHLVSPSVGDGLDRLNMYRGQSDCVSGTNMKLFCYCKDLLRNTTLANNK